MAHDDGGLAFPVNNLVCVHGEVVNAFATGGMSLRDWFAGQAMIGLAYQSCPHSKDDWFGVTRDAVAAEAYRIADAMIAARKYGLEEQGG